jgi:Electron transfer DM13
MNKRILIVIIITVAAVGIPIAAYTISPLFISNSINEPLPATVGVADQKQASQQYQKFVSMNEQERMNLARHMSQKDKNMVMIGAAQVINTINENTPTQGTIKLQQQQQQQEHQQQGNSASVNIRTGSFIGAGDGFHNAEGLAKIIPLGNESTILRLENFKSTNGPNVHVYLSTDKTASNFIDLGRLKANNGNQNYYIANGTDFAKYHTVLIWCKDFSVLFGSAELST